MTPSKLEPISQGAFCDYCKCSSCQKGDDYWAAITGRHECADGTHICGVCYSVEPCGHDDPEPGKKRGRAIFCPDHPKCEHKPKLKED